MLRLDSDCSILDHKAKMVECNSDDEDWHIIANRTRLKQIDGEVEEVVVLSRIQFSRQDKLVHLTDFRVHDGTTGIFCYCLVLAKVQEDLSDENTTV